MTYVRPSNMKLIDRTIRYVQQLLGTSQPGYPEVARAVFTEMQTLKPDEPIVLRVVAALQPNWKSATMFTHSQ
jgi:N-acetylmuramic acid 6-phosphate etherase